MKLPSAPQNLLQFTSVRVVILSTLVGAFSQSVTAGGVTLTVLLFIVWGWDAVKKAMD